MNQEKITYISIESLEPFPDQPFKPRSGQENQELEESIRQQGTIEPLVIRPLSENKYQIISGHRRVEACRKLGIHEVPAVIREMSDDQAVCMMVDANLQREHLLPSEKAFAYKMKMEAMGRQGQRTDLTLGQVGPKLRTDEKIAREGMDSARQIKRYIRLTCLIPDLLQMVDEGKISFTPAVELSYLSEQEQRQLLTAMTYEDCTPSLSQACRLKKLSQEYSLTPQMIESLMTEEKANQKQMLKVPVERIQKYAPKASGKELEDFVVKACEHYRKYLQRRQNRER